jgi:anti-sigma-K factor RskA
MRTDKAIQQRYQRDDKFQDMVDRYLAKFEDLLKHSASADPESVLSATFITADVGKLYLVMSRSLGRATEH